MRSLAVLAFCFLVLAGCGTGTETGKIDLTGSWRLADISAASGGVVNDEAAHHALARGELMSFFEDGFFSDVPGEGPIRKGKWQKQGTLLYFISGRGTRTRYSVEWKQENGREKLVLKPSSGPSLVYIREAFPLAVHTDDPFYPANIAWRNKPVATESAARLQWRVSNYVKHLALLLHAAKERRQKTVSFEFSQGVVRIYSGAIGLYPYDAVEKTWNASFYNKEDAYAAYRILADYLSQGEYHGAATGEWLVDDYHILQEIYTDLARGAEAGKGDPDQ